MQKLFAGIFALIWILAATAQPEDRYCNARFGFCVDVPAPLKSAGEGENGDGSKFYVPGKAVEVIASASHYVADDAPQQWLQQQNMSRCATSPESASSPARTTKSNGSPIKSTRRGVTSISS